MDIPKLRRRLAGDRDRYLLPQILLHWAVVILVFVQWMTFDAIHRTHGTILPPKSADLIEHAIHTYSGITIGALMTLRLGFRFWHGAPGSAEWGWRAILAVAVHWGLYAVLFAQAATGFTATYLWGGAGRIHVVLWNVILAFVFLHVAGALFHLVRRDRLAARMMPFMSATNSVGLDLSAQGPIHREAKRS